MSILAFNRLIAGSAVAALALVTSTSAAFAFFASGSAHADDLSPQVMPPAPAPSSAPATAVSPDGWTLTLSGRDEYRVTVPTPPNIPPNEVIVGGTFAATLVPPNGRAQSTPSGTVEVGYETQCSPSNPMMAIVAKTGVLRTEIVKQDFTNLNPSVRVDQFRVSAVCPGQIFARSYAILTRTDKGSASTVAYYGVFTPL